MANRKLVFLLCLFFLSSLFISGCFGRLELEEVSLVTLLGVDKGQKERILATAVIAVPRKARPSGGGGGGSSGSGDGGGGESKLIISAEGKDITEALDNVDIMSSRVITTMHTQMVVIGEDLAKEDVSPIADVFTRNLDFRHNTLVAVCQGKASDFLRKMSFPEETEPSAYLTELVTTAFSDMGVTPLITAHEFVIGYDTLESEPWAPYLVLASKDTADEKGEAKQDETKEPAKSGDQEGKSQKGGKAPSVVSLKGSCAFRKVGDAQKMVGTLDLYETMAVNMMRSSFQRGSIDVAMPMDSDKSTTIALHHFSSSVSVKIVKGKPFAKFTIRVTGSIEETLSKHVDITPEVHKTLVFTTQDQIRLLLSNTLDKLKELGSDVVDVGMTAHKNFLTWQEWEKYNWPERFKDLEAEFDVKVHLFTSGFTLSPPVPR